jgi:hypothetical protein
MSSRRVPLCRRRDIGYERKGSLTFYVARVKMDTDSIRYSAIAMMIGIAIINNSVSGMSVHSKEYMNLGTCGDERRRTLDAANRDAVFTFLGFSLSSV